MTAVEKHYRVKELSDLWGLSAKAIIRLFRDEPGVLRLARDGVAGKRRYATLSIPESVALRVHERLSNQALQSPLAGSHPPRVIRLSDFNAGVAKKARHVIKLQTT